MHDDVRRGPIPGDGLHMVPVLLLALMVAGAMGNGWLWAMPVAAAAATGWMLARRRRRLAEAQAVAARLAIRYPERGR
jgi:hypothetical protein